MSRRIFTRRELGAPEREILVRLHGQDATSLIGLDTKAAVEVLNYARDVLSVHGGVANHNVVSTIVHSLINELPQLLNITEDGSGYLQNFVNVEVSDNSGTTVKICLAKKIATSGTSTDST